MGKTQAGKSTTLLGNGNVSKTKVPQTFVVDSALPVYEAYRIADGETISLDNLSAKFDDQEDYREFVMSLEKDPSKPSEIFEFQFLKPPGLNDAADSDNANASNIINEMIGTKSFNLIVVIVSYKNPLTQEQQLTIEYYANVFKGLHARIMFLHTHVDYNETHHTNTIHHRNMKMRNKALSKIFQRHESEVDFDEDNFQEYPSLSIDMVASKKWPIINCLIRNTIRQILKMAMAPAAVLDTSVQNIERIRAITHPTKFNDEERKKIKLRSQAEAAKPSKVEEVEQVDVGGKELDQINILLIGDIQSGKTSLIG
ncbi:hypothetical protein BG000_004361 [Podila horticola]|nr:hypothetical protein BG000_004361 [Podila horticola]